ncbi:MAG: SPOR domain-containing protein [Silanimonas sp.]
MDVKIKQRLIGALVLGALAVIFIPMIVIGPESKGAADAADVPISVPDAPDGEFVTREIPLGPPAPEAVPAVDGVTAANPTDPNALATVDATANVAPRVDALDADTAVAIDAATGLPTPVPAPAEPASSPGDAETPVAATPAPTPEPARPAPVTPAPAPAAAPIAPAAVAAGDYSVTAGSFGNRANADALVARLKSSGLPAYTEAAQANGQAATRVKVGPFATRAAAEAARVRTAAISGSAAVATGDAAPSAAPTPTAPSVATAARPAVEAPRAAPSASGFAVQLGAFASQTDAQALVSRARAAGFASFEQRVPTANGVLWRVRLGPAADRTEAERMKSDAAGKLGVSGIVVPHP